MSDIDLKPGELYRTCLYFVDDNCVYFVIPDQDADSEDQCWNEVEIALGEIVLLTRVPNELPKQYDPIDGWEDEGLYEFLYMEKLVYLDGRGARMWLKKVNK